MRLCRVGTLRGTAFVDFIVTHHSVYCPSPCNPTPPARIDTPLEIFLWKAAAVDFWHDCAAATLSQALGHPLLQHPRRGLPEGKQSRDETFHPDGRSASQIRLSCQAVVRAAHSQPRPSCISPLTDGNGPAPILILRLAGILETQQHPAIGRHKGVREGLVHVMRHGSDDGKYWACYAIYSIGCSNAASKVCPPPVAPFWLTPHRPTRGGSEIESGRMRPLSRSNPGMRSKGISWFGTLISMIILGVPRCPSQCRPAAAKCKVWSKKLKTQHWPLHTMGTPTAPPPPAAPAVADARVPRACSLSSASRLASTRRSSS